MVKDKKAKNIGIEGVETPKETCDDQNCPFHGDLRVRGRQFIGVVVKKDPHKTIQIEWPRRIYLHKYERYEKRRSRIKAHNPSCIDAKVGDTVKVMETRPISKTKSFVVVQIIKKNETD